MVTRIEKIVNGEVIQRAIPYMRNDGMYFECFMKGETMNPIHFDTPDEAANFLLENRRGRIRMHPGSAITVNNIHIDGVPRENL